MYEVRIKAMNTTVVFFFVFLFSSFFFFFQAEDGIRDDLVTGVQTCALPISPQHLLFLEPLSLGDEQRR